MEDIEILEKELRNIRNLIDYYTFESLDYDKKYRMERFKTAIENILKERQADKEKIKELGKDYAEMLIKLNAQNLNNSIELIKRSNEQVEALNDAWKIEWEKKDNRIKELESDKEIKDKMIDLMAFAISSYDGQLVINQYKDRNEVKAKFKEYIEDGTYEQYFENLAKESDTDEHI